MNKADEPVKVAAQNNPLPPDVFLEISKHGSIQRDETLVKFMNTITSEDWRTTIMTFLNGHFVPEDEKEERRMKKKEEWPFGLETILSSTET